jgi:hypothetical protein
MIPRNISSRTRIVFIRVFWPHFANPFERMEMQGCPAAMSVAARKLDRRETRQRMTASASQRGCSIAMRLSVTIFSRPKRGLV